MAKQTVPTIADFLDSMGDDTIDTLQGQLATYARLAYHWDGTDRSKLSLRKLRALVSEIDTDCQSMLPGFEVEAFDDDDADQFGIRVSVDGVVSEVRFESPTLANSYKPDTVPAKMIRQLIDRLGQPDMYQLPYLCLPALVQQGGKAAGFL